MRAVLVACVLFAGCGEVVSNRPDAPPGDADPCASGTCECTVATEATDCGNHEYCNESATGRTCDCVAGYTDGGSGCVWTGSIQDPGISMQAAWTPANGALLNPTANTQTSGGIDAGEASFVSSALCGLGYISQDVVMPTFAKSEPLVLELSYKSQGGQFGGAALMGVSFAGGWAPYPGFGDGSFHTIRRCLPAAAYAPDGTAGRGAPVKLALGPYREPPGCPSVNLNFAIDHARIVPANAGECGPTFGDGPNGDAEGMDGWTFERNGSPGTTAGFANGVGQNGSRGARLLVSQRCDSASMDTRVSVVDVPNPALEMWSSASGMNTQIDARIAEYMPLQIPQTAGTTRRFCLPPSLRGQSAAVTFSVNNNSSGVCNEVTNNSLVVDNLRTVDEPLCASSAIAAPGFETNMVGVVGLESRSYQRAVIRTGPGARTGMGFLALEALGPCYDASYSIVAIGPSPNGAAGPALAFYANVPANSNTTTSVRVGTTSSDLPEGAAGYQRRIVCLPAKYAGRPVDINITHSGGSGSCTANFTTPQSALFDDFELTTDPSCPAQ